MEQLLQDHTAVITGAAGGLGLAIARAFIDEGANVVLGDVDEDGLRKAVATLPSATAAMVRCDVTSSDDMNALCELGIDRYGSINVMVNNAGITRDATMRNMTEEEFDEVVNVHLKGCWLGTRAAANVMRDQATGGSIINVSSISGKVGMIGQTNYSAAKAGIIGLTKAAAKEVGFAGVRVNAIQPGVILTPMTDGLRPDVLAAKLAEVPMGRAGEANEVAAVAVFLASRMSSYVTGAIIEVAGGRHI